MAQENVEIFKRGVEAWNGDDYDGELQGHAEALKAAGLRATET